MTSEDPLERAIIRERRFRMIVEVIVVVVVTAGFFVVRGAEQKLKHQSDQILSLQTSLKGLSTTSTQGFADFEKAIQQGQKRRDRVSARQFRQLYRAIVLGDKPNFSVPETAPVQPTSVPQGGTTHKQIVVKKGGPQHQTVVRHKKVVHKHKKVVKERCSTTVCKILNPLGL